MTGTDGPGGSGPMEWWDELLADSSSRVAEYEDDGWDAFVLHPGDVTVLDGTEGDRVGLSVLVPDDEYDQAEDVLAADGALERYQVYRRTVSGHLALVLALETADETALVCPAYYALDDDSVEGLFATARGTGELSVYLRKLDGTSVEISLDEPSLLAPAGE